MSANFPRLVRHLIAVVLLKLVALTGLWWTFVHDSPNTVDDRSVARHLASPETAAAPSTPPSVTGATP